MRRFPVLILALGVLSVAAVTMRATAQAGPGAPATQNARPDGPGGGPRPPAGFHMLPRFIMEKLQLTEDQAQQVAALEKETKAKLDKILTPEQQKILNEMRPPRRPPQDGPDGGGPGGGGPGGPPDQGGPPQQ